MKNKKPNFKYHRDQWLKENFPIGKKLGYPECCIRWFCSQPPAVLAARRPTKIDEVRFKAAHVNGKYTGFIPCPNHANLIIAGKMTLASLVKNRDKKFPPFPNY